MKTVLIDCSPKKRLSASGFLAWFTGLFIKGERVREKLRTKRDHERILNTIKDAETVVFASVPVMVADPAPTGTTFPLPSMAATLVFDEL